MTAFIIALVLSADPIEFRLERGGDPTSDPTASAGEATGEESTSLPQDVAEPGETVTAVPPAYVSLRSRIASYRGRGGVAYYENGGNSATTKRHMVADHGWSMAELDGLSQSELDLLHGMSHTSAPELIACARTQNDGDGIPVEYINGAYYWTHPTLGRRFARSLQEGANYKGLTYRDGKMWPTEPLPHAPGRLTIPVPSVEPLIQLPQKPVAGRWEQYRVCRNGQCSLQWRWVAN